MEKHCPIMDDDGDCMLRVSIKHTKCYTEKKFEDVECAVYNCPVFWMVEQMQDAVKRQFSFIEDEREREKINRKRT